MNQPRKRTHFIAGDPLRAIAALSVLVFHAAFTAAPPRLGSPDYEGLYGTWPGHLLGDLDMGLYVFFVLSGYLLSAPFLRAVADGTRPPPLGGYVRNRLLRIVPAFWVAAGLTALWFGVGHDNVLDVLAVFGFMQTYRTGYLADHIGQAWTLHVELGYYLLLPLAAVLAALVLARVAPGPRRLRALVVMAAVGFAAGYALRQAGSAHDTWTRSIPAMLYAFFPGVVLAALEPLVTASKRLRRLAPKAAVIALVLFFVGLAYALDHRRDIPRRDLVAPLVAGALVAAPLAWQWSGRRTWRAFDNRTMHWLGQRSYSIYLVHNGILLALAAHLRGGRSTPALFAIELAIGLPVTILASAALYRFVERPALLRRRRGLPGADPMPSTAP